MSPGIKQIVRFLFCSFTALLISVVVNAQCSICSKTASQMGEDAGRGLNGGILYLASAPLLIAGYLGYRWWKNND